MGVTSSFPATCCCGTSVVRCTTVAETSRTSGTATTTLHDHSSISGYGLETQQSLQDHHQRPAARNPIQCPPPSSKGESHSDVATKEEEEADLSLSDQMQAEYASPAGGKRNNANATGSWHSTQSDTPLAATLVFGVTTAAALPITAVAAVVSPSVFLKDIHFCHEDDVVSEEVEPFHDDGFVDVEAMDACGGIDNLSRILPTQHNNVVASTSDDHDEKEDNSSSSSDNLLSDPPLFLPSNLSVAVSVSTASCTTHGGRGAAAAATTPLMMSESELRRQLSAMMPLLDGRSDGSENAEVVEDLITDRCCNIVARAILSSEFSYFT